LFAILVKEWTQASSIMTQSQAEKVVFQTCRIFPKDIGRQKIEQLSQFGKRSVSKPEIIRAEKEILAIIFRQEALCEHQIGHIPVYAATSLNKGQIVHCGTDDGDYSLFQFKPPLFILTLCPWFSSAILADIDHYISNVYR